MWGVRMLPSTSYTTFRPEESMELRGWRIRVNHGLAPTTTLLTVWRKLSCRRNRSAGSKACKVEWRSSRGAVVAKSLVNRGDHKRI